MKTLGSISHHSQVLLDENNNSCSDLSDEHVFFNVSKVYIARESFTFQSTMQIECGTVFGLKIKQVLQCEYKLKDMRLDKEQFKEVVHKLYSDSLLALQDFTANTRDKAKRSIPNITITPDVLSNYFSSMNYKDLYRSCFSE